MDLAFIQLAFTNFLALIISLSFHEAAHAFCAKWQGDNTAELEGRMTINPIPHIDILGTIILPLSSLLLQAPILIGWAKPVPVNPRRFKNGLTSEILVAGAGPAANLILCTLSVLIIGIYSVAFRDFIPKGHFLYPLLPLIATMSMINAFLAVFNLIPLPPLDGGTVIKAILPRDVADRYEEVVAPYGTYILLFLLFTGGMRWLAPIAQAYVGLSEKLVGLTLMAFV